MTRIHHLLTSKGHGFYSVSPTDTVYEAIKMMADKDVGSLLVMESDKLVGMFTERQYARDVILKGRTSPQTLVREVMEPEVVCVGPDETVEACMALMTEKRVRHLPVVDGERVIGIVSIGDLVKRIIDNEHFTIHQLESYIYGERFLH